MEKTFEFIVDGKKQKLIARDDIQAAAFEKAQKELKERAEQEQAAETEETEETE